MTKVYLNTPSNGALFSPQATPAKEEPAAKPVVGGTEAGTAKEPCVGCGQTACTGKYGACRIRIATPQVTMKTYSIALEDVVGVLNKMVNSIEPDQTLSRLDWVTPEHDLTPSPRAVLMVDDQSEPP